MDTKSFTQGSFGGELLDAYFHTAKKQVQEYVNEIERNCRYKSARSSVTEGTILDDRGRIIDLYDACVQQDAHLRSVMATLESQILGDRYMMATINEKGKYIKDVDETEKVQGTQFDKIIKGIVEKSWYGYTLLEIFPSIDPMTGKLKYVNQVERRNVLPDQNTVVRRQGIWLPNWNIIDPAYINNYILLNNGDLGLFSATTPWVLAKKFTIANFVAFSHTYGKPIIHGKTASDGVGDRRRLANEISGAASDRVIVTGTDDSIDVKAFTMSNSEKIYTSIIECANSEVSNLLLGSESMAGATQSYVGSTQAHQDIFRDRVEAYRRDIENCMNEQVIPRLVKMGYLKPGRYFKYSNRIEMNNEDRIKLFNFLTDKYEVSPDEIEKEFGVNVGKQINSAKEVNQNKLGKIANFMQPDR